MTIDEAIAHAREVAIEKSSIATELSLSGKDTSECIKCVKECEQLAEWLEELKSNRIALEKANGYLEVNHRLGYNKAIDDFLEKIQWEYLNGCGIKQSEIDFLIAVSSRVAEQLKAGIEDEKENV